MNRVILIFLMLITLIGCEKKSQSETQIGGFIITEYNSTNMLFGPGPRHVWTKICAEKLDFCVEGLGISIDEPHPKFKSPIIEICDSNNVNRFFNKSIPLELKCEQCNSAVLDCSAQRKNHSFWLDSYQIILTTDPVTQTPIYNLLKFSDREIKYSAIRVDARFFYKYMPFQYLSFRPTSPGIAWFSCLGTDCKFRWIDLVSGQSHFEQVPCRVGDKLKIVWSEKHAELFTERDAKHYEICRTSSGKMLFPFEPEAPIIAPGFED